MKERSVPWEAVEATAYLYFIYLVLMFGIKLGAMLDKHRITELLAPILVYP